jgi:glycogen synthase
MPRLFHVRIEAPAQQHAPQAMERVFSWEDAAQTYGELYQRVAQ